MRRALRSLAIVAVAVTAWSCAHRRASNFRRVRPAISAATGVSNTMQRQVNNAIDAGDGDYRIRLLRERVVQEPDNLALRLELARYYEAHGGAELALEHYRLAAARFPEAGEVRLSMAKCLRGMGLRAEAVRSLEEFLKQSPQTSPEYASWLGILRDELGRFPQGEQAHRAALALATQDDKLHNNLGYNLLEQQRYEEAAAEFRRALELNPHSQVARNNLELASLARPGAAAEVKSRGDAAALHNNLGALLIEQGRYEEARRQLKLALSNGYFSAALNNLRLVSELDHKAAAVPVASVPAAGWKRFVGTLWRRLWGIQSPPAGRLTAERAAVPGR